MNRVHTNEPTAISQLYVAPSGIPGAGRGVFAGRPYCSGETIEVSPIIRFERSDPGISDARAMLPHYVFTYAEGYEGLALGFGSLYNHAYEPNAVYEKRHDMQAVVFIARYHIDQDEEITISYNDSEPANKTTPMNVGVPDYSPTAVEPRPERRCCGVYSQGRASDGE